MMTDLIDKLINLVDNDVHHELVKPNNKLECMILYLVRNRDDIDHLSIEDN